ncbi:RmlC-like cupin domain-containing protein [Dactylonectria estremocensis]|uniref:RmlC-like cupin domain-containing protein n=1 Tax=Dactylonectria estremocensis TaxID=1079267 RepID=A0A9P9DNL5_9HYPO|nr:RmlC-like cupin domain-containing protein [Dactylonectria estremocensis]
MVIPTTTYPPGERKCYVIDQNEGERIAIPGTNSVVRILASAMETKGRMAVYYRAAVPTDAPNSFYWHQEAVNAFIVTKGYLRFWNCDECLDLYPGDFACVPAGVMYSYKPLGPYTEFLALATPGSQAEIFRAMGQEFKGIMLPSKDSSSLLHTPPPDRRDVNVGQYERTEPSSWADAEKQLPGDYPYFLRANTGPQWMFGGILSRPFITPAQSKGEFSISTMETSANYPERPFFNRNMSFTTVDHCFCAMEGVFRLKIKGHSDWTVLRQGQMAFIPAREFFTADVDSKFVRVVVLSNGPGISDLIQKAGYQCPGNILPETVGGWDGWDEARLKSACAEVGAQID